MMKIHFVPVSGNTKTGPIPVTYSERETCPESCPHYRTSCYADAGFHTRMVWDKVGARGSSVADVADAIRALPPGTLWRHNIAGDLPGAGETVDPVALGEIVAANIGRRGFTYTHKKSAEAIEWAQHATRWGFTVNLSADDAGECDALADAGLPLTCVVPIDTPKHSTTPEGRPIVVCPAQTSDDVTCATCGLCQRANRAVIVGFRAHGTRARVADAKARRVIPIAKA
jgi:hypothetical protein